eukprot:gene35212-47325_t
MQTRGKKVKESKRGKKQRLPRAPPLPTSGNELHGPEQEDFTQEIKEVDDTALVKACLASKDSHAKARVAMDALGDRRGTEQTMADAGLALRTYWESIPPELAAAMETKYAAAHDLLALLTGDRATAAKELSAAQTEEDQPPTVQELQTAVAKVASARAIFDMRSRAIDDFFRAREPQVLHSGSHQQPPKTARVKKNKKQKAQPQPDKPVRSATKDPGTKRKTKAAGAGQPDPQQEEHQKPGVRTPRRRTPARADSPPRQRGEAEEANGKMPALYSDSSDDSDNEGNGEDQHTPPTYETFNDSDPNEEEDWGRQTDKDYNFDQDYADDEADVHAGIFAHGKVQSGYDYLKGAPELQFPSNDAPQAAILERINVSAISHGMVIPVLRRVERKPMSFGALMSPEAYYVVGPQGANM